MRQSVERGETTSVMVCFVSLSQIWEWTFTVPLQYSLQSVVASCYDLLVPTYLPTYLPSTYEDVLRPHQR